MALTGLRRRREQAGDKWHLDEVLLKIRGKRHWLSRAVDQRGIVLDSLVQGRRDQQAAEWFLRQVLEGQDGTEPRVVITDKLASYPPAIRQVLPYTEHRRTRLNNWAENSHLPTRKRERVLQPFNQPSTHSASLGRSAPSANHFRPRRHRLTASTYRQIRTERHAAGRTSPWAECAHETGLGDKLARPAAPHPPSLQQLDNAGRPRNAAMGLFRDAG